MKYVIEFGKHGGAYTDNIVVPTRLLAERLASSLVQVFQNNVHASMVMGPGATRNTWSNDTHFVALSLLDGVDRGPASATLWRSK